MSEWMDFAYGREELIDDGGGQWMNGKRVAYALAASPCEVSVEEFTFG